MSNVVYAEETEDFRSVANNNLRGLRDTCRCRRLPRNVTGVANANISSRESK